MRRLCLITLIAALAAGCGGSSAGSIAASSPAASPAPSAAAANVLPIGKELIALEARTYHSPEGFAPALTVDVPAGWSSIHRYDDAFDITQPDPSRDAPLVAVLWMIPPEPTAAAALAALKAAAGTAARPVTGRIGTTSAAGLDLTGGTGLIVRSVRSISVDLSPGERMRVLAADIGGKPLLVVIDVPVAASWNRLVAAAQPLIDNTRAA